MKVERTIQLAAAPEDVYRLVMDPRRLKDWVSIHERLKDAPNGELAQGSKLTQTLKVAGQRFTVRWTVVEDECPTRVVWEGRGPVRTTAKVTYELRRARRRHVVLVLQRVRAPRRRGGQARRPRRVERRRARDRAVARAAQEPDGELAAHSFAIASTSSRTASADLPSSLALPVR